MLRPDTPLDRAAESLASGLAAGMTRRSLLGRLGAAVLGAVGGGAVAAAVAPEEAEAFHFCGHIFTTDSCPSPFRLPRIDRKGYPLRPRDGKRIDNLGRLVNAAGYPVNATGSSAPRTGRQAPPQGAAHADLPGLGSRALPYRGPNPGLVVPLLQRSDPEARRLLLQVETEDQRGRSAPRILLRAPERVLRHVLRHGDPVLIEAAVVTAALVAGISGAWSP